MRAPRGTPTEIPGLSARAREDLETVIARHGFTERQVLAVLDRMAEPAEDEGAAEASIRRAGLRKPRKVEK